MNTPIHQQLLTRIQEIDSISVRDDAIVNSVEIRNENDKVLFDISTSTLEDSFITTYRFDIDDANYLLNENLYYENRDYDYDVEESNQYYEILKFVRK
mgnify:FL=1